MLLLPALTALALSMALIPLMMRLAPRLGMIDRPDPRKVHAHAIPRVGGIGIVLGALASIALWVPAQPWLPALLAGAAVLLLFGALDDALELGHYVKFVGQTLAACAVVYWGDLWVAWLPFASAPLDPALGKGFTVVALVGVINAINHSDGLDGLAGGESMMSLACMAYLGYLAGGGAPVLVAVAVMGGLLGFLRHNTHPARVFMGDAGSQFLGFSLGVLAILLTQRQAPSLSMALPLLLVGLPVADILAVLAQRMYHRMNWFRATRNHIHHRLLAIGFQHHQAVVIIYSVQASLVLAALALSYESDLLVTLVYLSACVLVFGGLILAERAGWRFQRGARRRPADTASWQRLRLLPMRFVQVSVPLYLIATCALAAGLQQDLSREVEWAVVFLACTTAVSMLLDRLPFSVSLARISMYVGASCAVYLLQRSGMLQNETYALVDKGYFVLLALAIGGAIRLHPGLDFHTTPLDYLLVGVVLAAAVLGGSHLAEMNLGAVILRLAALFYACELMLDAKADRRGSWLLRGSVLAASAIVATQGLAET